MSNVRTCFIPLRKLYNLFLSSDHVSKPKTTTTTTTTTPSPPVTNSECSTAPPPEQVTSPQEQCQNSVRELIHVLAKYNDDLNKTLEDNLILRDLVSRKDFLLKLSGEITRSGKPSDIVDFVLSDALKLTIPLKKAYRLVGEYAIVFELEKLDDMIAILKESQKVLKSVTTIGPAT